MAHDVLHEALALAPVGVGLIDRELRVRYANPRFAAAFGADREALLGKYLLGFAEPELAAFLARAAPLRFSGSAVERNVRTSTPRWDVTLDTALTTAGGEQLLLVVITDDAVRRSEEVVIERIAEAVSAKVGDDFFITLVTALTTMFGFDHALVAEVDEATGTGHVIALASGKTVISGGEYALAGTPCEQVVAGKSGWFADEVQGAFPADRRLRELGVAAYGGLPLRDADGRPVGLLAVLHSKRTPRHADLDAALQIVAARAGAELERRRSERAQMALQESLQRSQTLSAIGALVAGVAHEVRNPLFGISATLDAFAVELGVAPEVAEYVAVLRNDVDRLRRLMNDLLDYARPQVASLQVQVLPPLLAEALARVETRARTRGVALIPAVEEPLPQLPMDGDRMLQVLVNLLENGVEMAAAGGTVVPSVAFSRESRHLVIGVRADGQGFPADELSRAFEPFMTRRRGGTGLGLAIVRKIVEEHGGCVRATNPEGGGALVEVMLPVGAS